MSTGCNQYQHQPGCGHPTAPTAESVMDLVGGTFDPTYVDYVIGSEERHQALINGGYVPATPLITRRHARSTAGVRGFWLQTALGGEHNAEEYVPPMPDDYTPSMTAGNSFSGHRRTHRRSYEVDGWTFRFGGSVAAAKRFSAENGHKTFSMSVDVTDPDGRTVQVPVHVTRGNNGLWAVTPQGLGDNHKAEMVAAGVQAALEARRPTSIPSVAGGLAARARENAAALGADSTRNIRSTWIESFNYSDSDGMMTMKTQSGRTYGYSVSREDFEKVRSSTSPGSIYNQLVKRQAGRIDVAECPTCHRIYPTSRVHRCPIVETRGYEKPTEANERYTWAAASLATQAQKERDV